MLSVRRQGGVVVECSGQGIAFDPMSNALEYPAFISHAHADHAAAFRYPLVERYATEPTHRLVSALSGRTAGSCRLLSTRDKVRLGEIEVISHNAGHVLGSVQFEVSTPEGVVLYTGDFSLGDSYTMKPAETVKCDLLVMETTFGSPIFSFPKRPKLALDMVRWAAIEAVPNGRIPMFRTDSLGNAQEIISIFNRMTKLPVVTYRGVTKASDVYRQYGYSLDYVDAESDEGGELLESGKCVLVAPKGSKMNRENLEVSLASGWATIMKGRSSRSFPLSDHADFRGLLSFIRGCRPKRVLTFHGGGLTRDFASYVKRNLGLDARPLTVREETLMGTVSGSEGRTRACCEQLLSAIRIPGFVYMSSWLMREMSRRGFARSETEEALRRLTERGAIDSDGTEIKLRKSSS